MHSSDFVDDDRGTDDPLGREFHFGGSPGGGTTRPMLSREPLASEGEATIGPDNYNPYREREMRRETRELERRREAAAESQPELPTMDLPHADSEDEAFGMPDPTLDFEYDPDLPRF